MILLQIAHRYPFNIRYVLVMLQVTHMSIRHQLCTGRVTDHTGVYLTPAMHWSCYRSHRGLSDTTGVYLTPAMHWSCYRLHRGLSDTSYALVVLQITQGSIWHQLCTGRVYKSDGRSRLQVNDWRSCVNSVQWWDHAWVVTWLTTGKMWTGYWNWCTVIPVPPTLLYRPIQLLVRAWCDIVERRRKGWTVWKVMGLMEANTFFPPPPLQFCCCCCCCFLSFFFLSFAGLGMSLWPSARKQRRCALD